MSHPRFFVRIDKMRADPSQVRLESGVWKPPRALGSNTRVNGDTTGIMFHHDRDTALTTIWEEALPQDLVPVKTVSLYHYGSNFFAVPFDAIANEVPGADDANNENGEDSGDDELVQDWYNIGFNYPVFDPDPTYTSSVHIAGDYPRLWVRTAGQAWVERLFTDGYLPDQTFAATTADFGGIVGDLGVFLGLLALSVRPNLVRNVLETCLSGNPWRGHNRPRREGWFDARGVVVYIWTVHDEWAAFHEFESGSLGKFFY